MTVPGLARSLIKDRTWNFFMDAIVFAGLFAVAYAVVAVARYWFSTPVAAVEISLSPAAIPRYAFYSLVRMTVAYLLSLGFAIGYGYLAAYNKRVEGPMLAVLDILQSIPVLSFLPGVMLAMVSLFPSRQLGVEFGSIVLIFTGQVWNMAFSFYASLKALPRELVEASRVYRFSNLQRFLQLELPQGAIGLVWNSMVSVAGGWFFLMACEMFVLGKRDFRLPGLGSYLQSAASAGDTVAITWGIAAMIGVVVLIDQLVWRPAIAWSDKFKLEQVESSSSHSSPVLNLFRKSPLLTQLRDKVTTPFMERVYLSASRRTTEVKAEPSKWQKGFVILAGIIALLLILHGVFQGLLVMRGITRADLVTTVESAGATFLRVLAALVIASAWTIPAGVAIGFNPRLARIAQPVAQIAASVPATALFPVLLLGLVSLGGGLNTGSILLMLLGTQWYILFNVIAGAIAIPSEFREVADIFRFSRIDRWRTVILPAIFPYLITGLVTASGGAWNASIVAEYFHFKGQVLSTFGLGAEISSATDSGNFALLLLSTIVMATLVVSVNRLVWRPLYRRAETRYRLEA
ncbi:MAG TPA: ABC transporter permease subunit [Bryobacteraceae bacterium]|jgi:NitT/TauT family transport system permease protein|nr:ABC transporter permease subunit [Bryobacteraceae bacterium]